MLKLLFLVLSSRNLENFFFFQLRIKSDDADIEVRRSFQLRSPIDVAHRLHTCNTRKYLHVRAPVIPRIHVLNTCVPFIVVLANPLFYLAV